MSQARRYVLSLQTTHRGERPEWREPHWTAYHCLLIALLNVNDELTHRIDDLERRLSACEPQPPSG